MKLTETAIKWLEEKTRDRWDIRFICINLICVVVNVVLVLSAMGLSALLRLI